MEWNPFKNSIRATALSSTGSVAALIKVVFLQPRVDRDELEKIRRHCIWPGLHWAVIGLNQGRSFMNGSIMDVQVKLQVITMCRKRDNVRRCNAVNRLMTITGLLGWKSEWVREVGKDHDEWLGFGYFTVRSRDSRRILARMTEDCCGFGQKSAASGWVNHAQASFRL